MGYAALATTGLSKLELNASNTGVFTGIQVGEFSTILHAQQARTPHSRACRAALPPAEADAAAQSAGPWRGPPAAGARQAIRPGDDELARETWSRGRQADPDAIHAASETAKAAIAEALEPELRAL